MKKEPEFDRIKVILVAKKGRVESTIAEIRFPFAYIVDEGEQVCVRTYIGPEFIGEEELTFRKKEKQ